MIRKSFVPIFALAHAMKDYAGFSAKGMHLERCSFVSHLIALGPFLMQHPRCCLQVGLLLISQDVRAVSLASTGH
jgi:hypothetical protein